MRKNMTRIRAVSLDLDNTLWEAESVLLAAEKEMRSWLAANVPNVLSQLSREKLAHYKQSAIAQRPELRHRVSEIRIAVLYQALRDANYPEAESHALAAAAFQVFYVARQKVTLFDSVPSLLQSLSRDYQLISITNGNANPDIIGLSPYFLFSLSAESEGVGKPDPKIFHNALARLSLSADEVVHVGDHLIDDVAGAAGVGMKTVWLNMAVQDFAASFQLTEGSQLADGSQAQDCPADAVIRCISQLPGAISSL